MTDPDHHDSTLIIGGSVAGFTTAAELRELNYPGAITLVDPHVTAYDRPPLSAEYLSGEMTEEQLRLAPNGWFDAMNVTWIQDTVTGLETTDRGVIAHLRDSSEPVHATTIVLATGAHARTLPENLFGDSTTPVVTVRNPADADQLRERLDTASSVTVIGAGLLASEIAGVARQVYGCDVTLVAPHNATAEQTFGSLIAERLHALHPAHGTSVVEEYLTAENAETLTAGADLVVAAIGMIPNSQLAADLGADLLDDTGPVIVGATSQRTSIDNVYAVGDVALGGHHWQQAQASAARAAADIAGSSPTPLGTDPHWVWTDMYGYHAEAIGDLSAAVVGADHPGVEVIYRAEDPAAPVETIVVSTEGQLIGVASLQNSMAIRAAKRIMTRGITVDIDQLRDPSVPLKQLVRPRR